MKVVFKEFGTEAELGCKEYSDILETLIPAYRAEEHDMFLMKRFSAQPATSSWQIKSIEVDVGLVEIELAPANHPYSVARHAKTQSKPAQHYLQRYTIVEVDFGFYSDAFSPCGALTKNESITSALLPGELHKKRPCIVLRASHNRAQVVPMTTSAGAAKNPKNIPINEASFSNLADRYTEKQSYALLEMVQTVSANRIFPPREDDGKHHHRYGRYSLCSNDKTALKDALAEQYNEDIVVQKNTLQRRFDNLNHEKARLLEANKRVRSEVSEVGLQKEKLEALVLSIGLHLELGKTVDEIAKEVDRQFG